MKLKSFFKAVIFISLISLKLNVSEVNADVSFQTDVKVEYKVDTFGITQVINEITIHNNTSESYATDYILNLDNITPINPEAYQGQDSLSLKHIKKGENSYLQVNFDEAVVGIGKTRTFTITYNEETFAQRTGEVWEIVTPKLSEQNSFRKYEVVLSTPVSFGKEAYISPVPISKSISDGIRLYNFDKKLVEKSGITAGFGEFQVFSFNLKYHLENPLRKTTPTKIAIPPDTSIQRVFYALVDPKPVNIEVDEDGNWLALYNLKSRERLDVNVSGSVQIFSSPRKLAELLAHRFFSYTKATEYWQADDEQIKSLSSKLKTPESIYNFVVEYLSYDYKRVKPNVERLGAKKALNSPNTAICTEFTDLFVALARSAGIPAREIHGFAYTENPEVQPLSLVSDVLHAWPEYWSVDKEKWIPVDPTWAATGGGVDFFNKFDLRHFAFVIHASDDTKPYAPGSYKLGPNPQKDVYVSFGQLPKLKKPEIEITATPLSSFSLLRKNVRIEINNKSNFAIYDLNVDLVSDDILQTSEKIDVLPPFGKFKMQIEVPIGLLGKDTPKNATIKTDYADFTLPSFENQAVISQLAIICTLFIALIIITLVKTGKIDTNDKSKISTKTSLAIGRKSKKSKIK